MNEGNVPRTGGIFTAFAVGAIMGAGLALLFAPQSGSDTRAQLTRKSRELRGSTGELLDNVKGKVLGTKDQLLAAVAASEKALKPTDGEDRRTSSLKRIL